MERSFRRLSRELAAIPSCTGRAGVTGTSVSFACENESLIIPAIEKYIGNSLNCIMPDESLLAPVPHTRA